MEDCHEKGAIEFEANIQRAKKKERKKSARYTFWNVATRVDSFKIINIRLPTEIVSIFENGRCLSSLNGAELEGKGIS